MPQIQELSSSVRAKLRSGIAIASVGQCVEELVVNAVDSGATNIAVRVDLDIFRIQVVDNGEGISKSNIKLLGSRYATSKCHNVEDLKSNLTKYGFRGEALASIIQMSGTVDIVSCHRNSTFTSAKLFIYGKEKSITHRHTQRPSCGTTVTIQDFMYNMPVRKRIMKEAIDIENIKSKLEKIGLILPRISFILRNDKNKQTVLEIKRCRSLLDRFVQLFGPEHRDALSEVHYSLDQFEINGYISTQAHQTKGFQFIYINRRPVLQTKIHSFLNDLLNHSSIIRSKVLPNSALTGPGKLPSSPPKGLRFYGIFVLDINAPRDEYDICLEPKKTLVEFVDWEKILLCVEELVLKFIKEEDLTISLDERFRKTQKNSPSDFELPVPHNSQAKLKVFSNPKYNSNNEFFNRDVEISDAKSIVYGVPVKRRKHSSSDEQTADRKRNRRQKLFTVSNKTKKDYSSNDGKAMVVDSMKPIGTNNFVPVHNKQSLKCSELATSKESGGNKEASINKESNLWKCSSLEALRRISASSSNNPLKQKEVIKLDKKIEGKSKLSSLQELKRAHEIFVKEIKSTSCVTPFSKTIPSVSPNSSVLNRKRNKEAIFKTDDKRQRKSKDLLIECSNKQSLSHSLGKTYQQSMKKRKTLESFRSFKFQRCDENGINGGGEKRSIDKKTNVNIESEKQCNEITGANFNFHPVISFPTTLAVCENIYEFSKSNMPNECLPERSSKLYFDDSHDDSQGMRVNDDVVDKRHKIDNVLKAHQKCSPNNIFGNVSSNKSAIFTEVIVKDSNYDVSSSVMKKETLQCGNKPEGKSKLSSLQELKFVHEMFAKEIKSDSCVTPVFKTLPQLSQNLLVMNQEKDREESLDDDKRQRKSRDFVTEHCQNETISYSPEKTYLQSRKERNVLKCPHSFKFQRCDEDGKDYLGEKERVNKKTNLLPQSKIMEAEQHCDETLEQSFHLRPVVSTSKGYLYPSSEKIMNSNLSNATDNFLSHNNIGEVIHDTEMHNDLQTTSIPIETSLNNKNNTCISPVHFHHNKAADIHREASPNTHPDNGLKDDLILNSKFSSSNYVQTEHTSNHPVLGNVMKSLGQCSSLPFKDLITDRNFIPSTQSYPVAGGSLEYTRQKITPPKFPSYNVSEMALDQTQIVKENAQTQTHSEDYYNFENCTLQDKDLLPLLSVSNSGSCSEMTAILSLTEKKLTDDAIDSPAKELSEKCHLNYDTDNVCSLEEHSNNFLELNPGSVSHFSGTSFSKGDRIMQESSNGSFNLTSGDYSSQIVTDEIMDFTKSNELSPEPKIVQGPLPISNKEEKDQTSCHPSVGNGEKFTTSQDRSSVSSLKKDDGCSTFKEKNIALKSEIKRVEKDFRQTSWKAVSIANGKTIYINLRTGNTSFLPPPQDPTPTWKASQAMGAPPLIIPITGELNSLERRNMDEMKHSFTLSHGFKAFLPRKRKTSPFRVDEQINKKNYSKHIEQTSSETESRTADVHKQSTSESQSGEEKSCKINEFDHKGNGYEQSSDLTSKDSIPLLDIPNENSEDLPVSSETSKALDECLKKCVFTDETFFKWGDNEIEKRYNQQDEAIDVVTVESLWQTKHNFPMDAEILSSHTLNVEHSSSASTIKSYNIVHPYKFTREMLKKSKVFGQVDKKFIALALPFETSFPNLIILVDQHAADERVQLERTLDQSYELKQGPEGRLERVLKSASVIPPIEIFLNQERVRLMKNFRGAFFQLGLDFSVVNDTTVLFHRLPSCLVAQDSNEKYTRRCQTASFIAEATVIETCENIRALGGTAQEQDADPILYRPLPRSLAHVINTIACKSAVKFGDSLSTSECQSLISSLSNCQLPFQCAHGRPSLVPIVDLNYLKEKLKQNVAKPNLKKISEKAKR